MALTKPPSVEDRIKISEAARNAPASTVVAAAAVLRAVVGSETKASLADQMLRALVEVIESIGSSDQSEQAHSGYAALLDVLEQPDLLGRLREDDPLAPARLRGLRMRERLLDAEGGTRSAAELATMLRVTRQAVDKRRRKGTLVGLDLGRRGYAYPVWQVGLHGLSEVLGELREYDPWTQVAFMLSPNIWLDGETPLRILRDGQVEPVLRAAMHYGEQTAA
jgi:hypothetical protein